MTRAARAAAASLVVAMVAGCADEGGSRFGPREQAALDAAATAVGASAAAFAVARAALGVDWSAGDLEAEAIAAAFESHAARELEGCAEVDRTGSTVVVDLGGPPGCDLPDGTDASGRLEARASSDGEVARVDLVLGDLVVEDRTLSGEAELRGNEAGRLLLRPELAASGLSVTGSVELALGEDRVLHVGEIRAVGAGGETTTATLVGVAVVPGACHPAAGTLVVERDPVTFEVEMDAETPSTGAVAVTFGQRTSEESLTAYGSCPGRSPD